MKYKETVQVITNQPWENLSTKGLLQLMVLSAYTASELAESLRFAINHHPDNKDLLQMASTQLMTDNLSYGKYRRQKNDHAAFLWHYISRHGPLNMFFDQNTVCAFGESYHRGVRNLKADVRIMSVFSRREELPGIFLRVLSSPRTRWSHPALKAYRFYLERNIALGSGSVSHEEHISDFIITDDVYEYYYPLHHMYDGLLFDHRTYPEY